MSAPPQASARKLGPWLAAFLVAGNMIGSGIYGLAATLGAIGSVSLLGWVVATVGAGGAAVVFACLAQASDSLDGVVGYTEEGLSAPKWGLAALCLALIIVEVGLLIALWPLDGRGGRIFLAANGAIFVGISAFVISRTVRRGAPLPDAASAEVGRLLGFAMALMYWLALWVGNVAISVAVAGYLSVFIPALTSPIGRTCGAICAIWVMTLLNLIGPRLVARFSSLALFAGLIPVLLLATAGWAWFNPHIMMASWNVSGKDDFHAMQLSMVAAFWAYTGVESAAIVAAVVREPKRNVPFATLLGFGLAAVVYLSASTVIMGLAPARDYAMSSAPLALAFSKIAGPTAALVVAVCALVKISGTLGGWMLVAAETVRAGADVHLFPGKLAAERRDQVPKRILVGMACSMSVIAIVTSSPTLGKQFEALINVSTIWGIIPYIFCAVGLLRLAQRLPSPKAQLGARMGAAAAIVFTGWTVATATLTAQLLTIAVSGLILMLWFIFGRRAWEVERRSKIQG